MEETTQINLRLPKDLVYDMEYIAQTLKVNRNDWLKVKIAELIAKEIKETKIGIMESAEGRFIQGTIDDKEFERRVGFKPNHWMRAAKKKQAEMMKKGREAAEKYIRDLADGVEERERKR